MGTGEGDANVAMVSDGMRLGTGIPVDPRVDHPAIQAVTVAMSTAPVRMRDHVSILPLPYICCLPNETSDYPLLVYQGSWGLSTTKVLPRGDGGRCDASQAKNQPRRVPGLVCVLTNGNAGYNERFRRLAIRCLTSDTG